MSLGLQFMFVMVERAWQSTAALSQEPGSSRERKQQREEATARHVHQAQTPWPTSPICAPSPTSYKLPMMLRDEAIKGVFN